MTSTATKQVWNTEGVWGWARERAGNFERGGKCLVHGVKCVERLQPIRVASDAKACHETCAVWKCPKCKGEA